MGGVGGVGGGSGWLDLNETKANSAQFQVKLPTGAELGNNYFISAVSGKCWHGGTLLPILYTYLYRTFSTRESLS